MVSEVDANDKGIVDFPEFMNVIGKHMNDPDC
jgi:hypothetical protein